jgi:hypothetical protein
MRGFFLFKAHGGKRERGNGNIMERVNLFEVHCMHVWNYHNEIPSNY